MAWKEICALSLISIAVILALPTVSASSDSLSDMKSSISGFDATPKVRFVEVDLGGHVHRLTPNGSAPGLASIAA
jgi:hypothetical protein